jgi:hypothetical protein
LGIAPGDAEHFLDPFFSGRNDRQTVAPALLFKKGIHRPKVISNFKLVRLQTTYIHLTSILLFF